MPQVDVQSLTSDLWKIILLKLQPNDLARAACVCQLWYSIVGDPVVLSNRFKQSWQVANVIGRPFSTSFWFDTNIGRFAISHTIKRWDSVVGLAVKYQVHVNEIKRLNNMMSDHGIHSRERLLIPIAHPELLHGKVCYIEVDPYAKREVAVLYLDDESPKHTYQAKTKNEIMLKKGLLDSMKRSLQEDEVTVHYYVSLANGDVKEAFTQYNDDLQWEKSRTRLKFPCFS